MTDELDMTPEQMELVRKLVEDIQKLGLPGVVGQYMIYANLYLTTINDEGRGATQMRAEQLMPLVLVLSQILTIPVEKVGTLVRALNDGTVRAMFQAKLAGKEEVEFEHADDALKWALDRREAGDYDQ
jgi:hypothetical protein